MANLGDLKGALDGLKEQQRGQKVDKSTYPKFKIKLGQVLKAHTDGQNKGHTLDLHLLTQPQWDTNPRSAITGSANRTAKPAVTTMPVFLDFVDPGGTQGERTLAYHIHCTQEKQAERQLTAHNIGTVNNFLVKALLTDIDIFDTDTVDYVRGNEDHFADEEVSTINARLNERLGTLDTDAYKIVSSIYSNPWHQSLIAFMNQEDISSCTLNANNMGVPEPTKLMALSIVFSSNASVMRYIQLFEDNNPTEADRTWPRMKAYLIAQDANITRGMGLVRADIYAQANAAAEAPLDDSPAGQAMATLSSNTARMFTTEEISSITINAVKAAMEQYMAQQKPNTNARSNSRARNAASAPTMSTSARRLMYCYFHGICMHDSRGCTCVKHGKEIYHRLRDSRCTAANHDSTRIFGHENCTHHPRCISEAEAKSATAPDMFPAMPGNAYK
jgi:hypothetical protein